MLNFFVAGSMASVGQRVSPRVLIAAGLALVGAGQALLTIVAVDSSWWLFLPGLLVAMVGTGILNPTVSQVALSSAPPEQSGLAAGVNDMFRQAGIAVGVAALGALVPAGAAFGDGSPQSYVDGLHDALWVGAVLAVAAAAATALLIRGHRAGRGRGARRHRPRGRLSAQRRAWRSGRSRAASTPRAAWNRRGEGAARHCERALRPRHRARRRSPATGGCWSTASRSRSTRSCRRSDRSR